jgi:hypothetical protein
MRLSRDAFTFIVRKLRIRGKLSLARARVKLYDWFFIRVTLFVSLRTSRRTRTIMNMLHKRVIMGLYHISYNIQLSNEQL